jgi:hypothetical protein
MYLPASSSLASSKAQEIENALEVLRKAADLSPETVRVLREAIQRGPKTGELSQEDIDLIASSRRPFKPASSKKQQLTAEDAVEIFKRRPKVKYGGSLRRGSMLHCKTIAPLYGVTPKTIRDVWSGRSWIEATRHLWTEQERERWGASREEDGSSPCSDTPSPTMDLPSSTMNRPIVSCVVEDPAMSLPLPTSFPMLSSNNLFSTNLLQGSMINQGSLSTQSNIAPNLQALMQQISALRGVNPQCAFPNPLPMSVNNTLPLRN